MYILYNLLSWYYSVSVFHMQQTHYGNFTTVVTIVTIVAIADEETRTAL